jgi:signal transduction histidine kinase/CheY-like chemotaxis protein
MSVERNADELRQITSYADELPVAIWVGRVPSGECVYVNRSFREILGIDPPEGAARGNYVGPYSVHTLDGAPYPEDQMPYERTLRAGKPVEVDDMVIHRHDGGRVYLRVYAKPLFDEAGQISHVLEAFTDISREVQSRDAQTEREAQLRQAQRMESLGSLAGGIAHDFNNLLTIIKMIGSHLSAKPQTQEVAEALRQIDEVTESAARLTSALLGFARQGKNLRMRISINEIGERVAELARRTVGRQITVVKEFCPGPLEVDGDPAQIEQLLMNLVVNAKDAISGHGRLVVRTSPQSLEPGIAGDLAPGDYAVIEVEDTGSGIPPEVRDRIFEPYFTTKTAGAVKGTGLGLATVFGIVESHHGRVHIARSGPEGTTVRVLLPIAVAPAQRISSVPEPKKERVAGRGTILVVDDEELVLRVTALALEELGFQVITASDGACALEEYQRAGGRIDAVVLDLVMPVMGGRETFLALRERDPELPVLLVTGYALNYEAQELLDLGVRELVAKPFSVSALSAALSRALRRD